ncbi:papain family cysteine protease (macronuclear) [Tetrahymena thermophila SB210]|uniref:Papain family cysteine protease n=1 Tax=Tetrahymena thermophila (strain SB210) TaxID=312017 RepID=Q24FA8_TETTS|nr:papain family cysteine protease [Tetrahymena thermophila SB210]EAS06454.1 papain family cysteine protease [Tetrahymena thermophila SB210]|eukprot:XP_001026699.1 papain family cysteine protease [Tetrahymena thermophila SB210]
MSSKIFLALLVFTCIYSCYAQQGSVVEALTAYNKWREENGKVYSSEAEKIYRQSVFLENYQSVQEHNKNSNHTYSVGINQFSDITLQEYQQRILMKNSPLNELAKNKNRLLQSSPIQNSNDTQIASSIDWRKKGGVSPVKNQGECGGCWTFSATGLMESFNLIHNKPQNVSLYSQQQLLDCVTLENGYFSEGCEGGVPSDAVQYAADFGVLSDNEYPYTGIQGQCNITSKTNGFQPVQFSYLDGTAEGLRKALNYGPVSVAMDASNMKEYTSGVFNNCTSKQFNLNHAVLAVGYDEEGNWIIKNSKGPNWGMEGYFLLAPGNTCGILELDFQITA